MGAKFALGTSHAVQGRDAQRDAKWIFPLKLRQMDVSTQARHMDISTQATPNGYFYTRCASIFTQNTPHGHLHTWYAKWKFPHKEAKWIFPHKKSQMDISTQGTPNGYFHTRNAKWIYFHTRYAKWIFPYKERQMNIPTQGTPNKYFHQRSQNISTHHHTNGYIQAPSHKWISTHRHKWIETRIHHSGGRHSHELHPHAGSVWENPNVVQLSCGFRFICMKWIGQ